MEETTKKYTTKIFNLKNYKFSKKGDKILVSIYHREGDNIEWARLIFDKSLEDTIKELGIEIQEPENS